MTHCITQRESRWCCWSSRIIRGRGMTALRQSQCVTTTKTRDGRRTMAAGYWEYTIALYSAQKVSVGNAGSRMSIAPISGHRGSRLRGEEDCHDLRADRACFTRLTLLTSRYFCILVDMLHHLQSSTVLDVECQKGGHNSHICHLLCSISSTENVCMNVYAYANAKERSTPTHHLYQRLGVPAPSL